LADLISSATETTHAPEDADHHKDVDHDKSASDAEHVAAAEAARRQARQDPLQG
jgi:hypothetical protein